MKIYLIGMPGCGKSTLGRELAKTLNLKYVELDEEIEKIFGKNIGKIFDEDGEVKFRVTESDLLTSYSKSNYGFVMSAGGGAPCYHDGIDVMNTTGISVYLKVSKSELHRRLKKEKESRPLLARKQSLESVINKLYLERGSIYDQAKIILESDNISVNNLQAAITRN